MQNLDPTYLRYIYDNLIKGSVHPENASELPEGLIGLYEEAFEEHLPVLHRQQLLQRFALFALLKKEVSAVFVAEVLGEKETDILEFINTYASWFNSPEPGKYQLYHERTKIYLLSKASSYEILDLSNKVLEFLKSDLSILEHNDYKLRFYLDHLAVNSYESDCSKEVLDFIVHQNDFWDLSFSVLKSTQPAIENIRNLISFSVYKKDWKLLYRCTQVILYMEQKNDSLCEQILKSYKIDIDEASFCFNSISSPLERLRFLTYLTIKIESGNELTHIDLNQFWDQLVNYVQTEYINAALIMPLWIKQRLQKIAENQQINSLTMVLDELDFYDINPITDAGILKGFDFLEDETEMMYKSEIDLKQYRKLKKTLRSKSNNFSEAYKIINTPNLVDRDELLCRATLDLIEFNHSNSYDWLFWLIVKSDFEWGGHVSSGEKYYTKNIIAKFISKSEFSSLKKIENLLKHIDLYKYELINIRCWISDRYYNLKYFKSAFEVVNVFNYSIEPSFNESEWKSAWFLSQNKKINIQDIHISKRLDTLLKYQQKVLKINFIDINTYLKPLDTDRVSKAEYFLETAVRIYKTRKKLSEELLNASWELIKDTNDWASVIVKIETVVAALNFMPESWIKQKLKKIKDEFQVGWLDYEWELTKSFQNFYNYHPSRFSDQNALKLSIGSKSVHNFLLEFDKEGLADAIENEKIEKLIIQKANSIESFRIFWTEFKAYFKSDGVGCSIKNFWSLFKNNKAVFKNITAEDIRIIGVISRKVNQHFPLELYFDKSPKLQLYQDRITIPDDWEFGSSKGFTAMISEKTQDKDTVCNAILESPRDGAELITTPIGAIGYMLKEIRRNKELVKNVQAFLELRKEIVRMNA